VDFYANMRRVYAPLLTSLCIKKALFSITGRILPVLSFGRSRMISGLTTFGGSERRFAVHIEAPSFGIWGIAGGSINF
jgi:hypothetical protein